MQELLYSNQNRTHLRFIEMMSFVEILNNISKHSSIFKYSWTYIFLPKPF